MSENILSEITNWLKSIIKAGDVEGHEFHGNQYSQGGGSTGGGKTDVAPTREGDPHRYATEGRWGQEPTKTELGKYHEDATKFHQNEATAARAKGDTASAEKHKVAADAHADAWRAHTTDNPNAKTVSSRAITMTREITNPNDIPHPHEYAYEGENPFKGNQYRPTGEPATQTVRYKSYDDVSESPDIEAYLIERFLKAEADPDCETCDGTGKIKGGHVDCPDCVQVKKDANESLADILRHDEGHDKWHAMHGDKPCKSEADCARMRAKYAEVKAEEAVSKGDVQGHEFHGNQYSSGQAAADLRTLATRAETAPVPSRVSTGRDVLGKVWTRDNAGYGYKVGERIGQSNKAIASHAREVADRIAANPEKPVAEHISDIRATAQARRDEAMRHMMADSFTGADMNERAAERLDGMADHLKGRMTEATAKISDAGVNAAVAIRRNDVPYPAPLRASQAPDGIHATDVPRNHGVVVIHVDGNVNPVTGKSSGGTKQASTFSNTKSYAIVQGRRPGGTIFTRMVQCDKAWRIGDTMRFVDGDSHKEKGPGMVVGITDPKTGSYYGTVPNRPLSHNSVY